MGLNLDPPLRGFWVLLRVPSILVAYLRFPQAVGIRRFPKRGNQINFLLWIFDHVFGFFWDTLYCWCCYEVSSHSSAESFTPSISEKAEFGMFILSENLGGQKLHSVQVESQLGWGDENLQKIWIKGAVFPLSCCFSPSGDVAGSCSETVLAGPAWGLWIHSAGLPRHGKPLLWSGLKLAVYFAVLETYFIIHSSAKRLQGFLPLLAPQLPVTADGGCFGLDPACGKWSGVWTEEVGSSQGSRRVGMALPRKMDRLEAGEVRRVFVEI